MVSVHYEDWGTPVELPENLESWLKEVCESESKELEELNIIFCSDDYLLRMNKEHLDHDYYTDIITFDYCLDTQVFGDLFISIDRVEDNARELNVQPGVELLRVIVHGTLHLLGYGDKTEEEQEVMRAKEDFYISLHSEK